MARTGGEDRIPVLAIFIFSLISNATLGYNALLILKG